MKKNKSIEMRIYELLGVKVFRKMAFAFRDILRYPSTIKMTKEERHNFLYNTASNYNLGKVKNLEDVKNFKNELYINASIHIYALLSCLWSFMIAIDCNAPLSIMIAYLPLVGINAYCIMLQRYNCIRINQLIKKMTPHYEKQKDDIKEELRKEDSLLDEHTYKIVDKKERETSVTFEELLSNATIEQLKQYREYLAHFQDVNQFSEKQIDISMPMEKNKTLKLELKRNK